MNSLIRKTFRSTMTLLLMAFALSACASGSKKTYCDLVVEDEVKLDDQSPKKSIDKRSKK